MPPAHFCFVLSCLYRCFFCTADMGRSFLSCIHLRAEEARQWCYSG